MATGAAPAEEGLRITPYLWYAGFDGTVGAADGAVPGGSVDADFSKLWNNLQLRGAMLNLSWRRARYTVFGDWTYAKVSSDTPTRVPNLYSTVNAEVRGNIAYAVGGYDVLARDDAHLDLYAGARYYDLDITMGLQGAALGDRTLGGGARWTDAVIGARGIRHFGGAWEAQLQGDIGTGGSEFSWQLIGTLGYEYSWGSLVGGWRYLESNYKDETFKLDAALAGPFLGATFAF